MDWNGAPEMTGWMWVWMGLWSLLVIAGIVAFGVVVESVVNTMPSEGWTVTR